MAVVPMAKIGIVGHRSDCDAIVKLLQQEGVVQIIPLNEREETEQEMEHTLRRIERVSNSLISIIKEKQEKPSFPAHKIAEITSHVDIDVLLDEAEALIEKYDEYISEIQRNRAQIHTLEPWKELKTPLSQIHDTIHCKVCLGIVPAHFAQVFLDEIIEQKLLFWREVWRGHGGLYIIIVYHKAISDWMESLLRRVEFTHWETKGFANSPGEEIEKLAMNISNAEIELAEIQSKIEEFCKQNIFKFWAFADNLEQLLEQRKIVATALHTKHAFVMQGWIAQNNYQRLKKRMETVFDTVEVIHLPVLPEEEPPVVLQNPLIIEAFEVLTDLYGPPRKGMVDPTPFVGPFFATYFGLCTSDAGYGLILTLISAVGLRIFHGDGTKKFLRLILYSGILSIVAGIITGSYWGIPLPADFASASLLGKIALSLKLFDPLRDIMVFFALAITFSFIQLSLAWILKGYVWFNESQKSMQRLQSVLLTVAWVCTTVGLGLFLIYNVLPQTFAAFQKVGVNMIAAGAIGIVFGHAIIGPIAGRSIGASLGSALAFDGLYGIIGVFADMLSFLLRLDYHPELWRV